MDGEGQSDDISGAYFAYVDVMALPFRQVVISVERTFDFRTWGFQPLGCANEQLFTRLLDADVDAAGVGQMAVDLGPRRGAVEQQVDAQAFSGAVDDLSKAYCKKLVGGAAASDRMNQEG